MTTVRVLGCSDAFSSGGRHFSSYLVESKSFRFLIDCGPTAVASMKRLGIDPDSLDAVLISHFHGDHYGGLPFLEIELSIMRRRSRPLAVGGPPGVEQRLRALTDAMYPALTPKQRVTYEFTEWSVEQPVDIGPLHISAASVIHTPESMPHALRIEVDGVVIAFSGDTEWTDALLPVAAASDLFICEATSHTMNVPNHLSYATILEHREQLTCRKLLLTHMGDEMLAAVPVAGAIAAEDGLLIEL